MTKDIVKEAKEMNLQKIKTMCGECGNHDISCEECLCDQKEWLIERIEELELENIGHGYALNILRKDVGLPSGESYQEVDKEIHRLQENNAILKKEIEMRDNEVGYTKELQRLQSQLAKYEEVVEVMNKGCSVDGVCGEQVAVYYEASDWDKLQEALKQLNKGE